MSENAVDRPWEALQRILATADGRELQRFLETLSPTETALAISRLSPEDQVRLMTLLRPTEAAGVIEDISDAQAVGLIEDLPPERAAAIVDEMPSDQQADLLGELTPSGAEAILEQMAPSEARDARRLLAYDPETAGGIMVTEYVAYRREQTVREVLDDLQAYQVEYADYTVQYLYVTDDAGRLVGVLRIRDLLFAPRAAAISKVMIGDPHRLTTDTPLVELRQFFVEHKLFGVPVVNERDELVGILQRRSVSEASRKEANRLFLGLSGLMGGEELRSMPLWSRSSRRLSWLSINIVLNIIAASVIAFYQDTLAAAITLAVFLPMISDMSGCSGNQAVAVSIRELTLGLIKPTEFVRVWLKESSVGVINGIVLGALLGGVALLWKGNPWLGLVVGGALAANTIVAVMLGGLLPLVLRRLKLDPALVAGPVLTTVTDMCGFFLVLSLATTVLAKLAG